MYHDHPYSPVLPNAPPTIIAFSPKERSKKGRKEKKEKKRRKERKKEEKKTSLICEVTSLSPSSQWLHQPTTTANMLAFNHGQPKCTFIVIKPDDMQHNLVGMIIKHLEQKGFWLVAINTLQASEKHLKQHYIDLKDYPFFPGLMMYMNSGPMVAIVWEGLKVMKTDSDVSRVQHSWL